jgi:hypothetical protein
MTFFPLTQINRNSTAGARRARIDVVTDICMRIGRTRSCDHPTGRATDPDNVPAESGNAAGLLTAGRAPL